MFPGQGAQAVGMGKDLAERFPQSRETFEAIDDSLGFALSRLMWEGPEEELTLTHNAQPAILAHSLAVLSVVGPTLDVLAGAGHSLGEYSAYAAAGSFSPAEAARLVRRRGELMLESGKQREGTMAAVLGIDDDALTTICKQASTDGHVVVPANLNAPGQTVISGDPTAVDRAGALCKEAGAKRVLPLKVSGAFHSPLMAPARTGLEGELQKTQFIDPSFPIIANATTELVRTASRGRDLLGEQLTAPVRWSGCMKRAVEFVDRDVTFVELGPGAVLAGLLKRIDSEAKRMSCATADDAEAMMAAVA